MLKNGLYEKIINKALEGELEELPLSDREPQKEKIDEAEAAKVLSKYIAQVTEQSLRELQDSGGDLKDQVALVNRIIRRIPRFLILSPRARSSC